MTMHPAAAYVRAIDWPAFEPDRHPETRRWIERIEAVRLEDAPPCCPTCGSTAGIARKWCPRCEQSLPIARFNRNRSRHDGRSAWCGACTAADNARYRIRRAIAALGRAS